ncbi:MAG: zinc-binding dehydrogenase [Bryobacterales bacterium]|nr:zinc-binding dehydrogenase [Bryobacterales bacterium]
MDFKAAVLSKVEAPLEIHDVEMTGLKPNDVLVRNHASGLCHTDFEVIHGSLRFPLPIVLGHEASGVVEAVGEAVTLVKPGDHVVCSWNPNCGHCFYCDQDLPILCEPFSRHVPSEIPFDRACLIGCGVMTGVGAVLRVARVQPGTSVVVIGCGAVGLNAIQGARLAGAEPIMAVDIHQEKLLMATAFGATHTSLAGRDDVPSVVQGLTRGRGADHVIEAAGIDNTLQLSLDVSRPGANVILLGKTDVTREVHIRWGSMMAERRIVRSSYGGARPRRDFPLLARLYLDGRLMLDELITRRISLHEINDGFSDMAKGSLVRAVVQMN